MEYLDPTSNEWTTFVPTKQNSKIKSILDLSLQQLAQMQQDAADDENAFLETDTDEEIKKLTGFKHENGNGTTPSKQEQQVKSGKKKAAKAAHTNGHDKSSASWKNKKQNQKNVNANGHAEIIDVQEHIKNISLDLDES
jgi:hypothetical protein